MSVKVKEAADFVQTMLRVVASNWGIRTLMEDSDVDVRKIFCNGNDLLGRLAEIGLSGEEDL